jgi:DeoR/GlpR family transcriptional regulator of sugar metabolism
MQETPPLARRALIAERLESGQSVMAAGLANEFNVSEDAIRRDLRALAAEGKCRRVYGGALPLPRPGASIIARIGEGRERKDALARAGASLIQPGEFVFLDSGSTNLALVAYLPDDLTVATNSIDIAAAILRRPELQLILVGGIVNPTVGGSVDAEAVQSVGRMNFDRCFLGICALSPASGLGAFDMADATFKRALLSASRVTVGMTTNEKYEIRAPHRIGGIGSLSVLVAEHDISPEHWNALTQSGTSLLRAGAPDVRATK